MGFFSWKTQDTNKSIANRYSNKKVFKVVMIDKEGNKWVEEDYEGYGVFGGKDYYQLLAEMNRPNHVTGDVNKDRLIGINIAYGNRGVRNINNPKEMYLMGIDFTNWEQKLPNGMTPNECSTHDDFEHITIKMTNAIFPNLTTSESWGWKNIEPENCQYQGYFY